MSLYIFPDPLYLQSHLLAFMLTVIYVVVYKFRKRGLAIVRVFQFCVSFSSVQYFLVVYWYISSHKYLVISPFSPLNFADAIPDISLEDMC